MGQVFDVFQNKVAGDEIAGSIFTGPASRQIRCLEADVSRLDLFSRFLDHSLRKIQRVDACPNLHEEDCVLAGAASQLKDGVKALAGEQAPCHL